MIIHAIWAGKKMPAWSRDGLRAIRDTHPSAQHFLWTVLNPEQGELPTDERWDDQDVPDGWEIRDFLAYLGANTGKIAETLKPYDARTVTDIITFEQKCGGYSAIKDLAAFLVLELEGGLYLDSSMRAPSIEDITTAKGGTTAKQWTESEEPQRVRVPLISDDLITRDILNLSFIPLSDHGITRTQLPQVDVWAIYAKKGSETQEVEGPSPMSNAAAFMISRYMHLLNSEVQITGGQLTPGSGTVALPAGEPTRFTYDHIGDTTIVGIKMEPKTTSERELRNYVIGHTVMSALLDALVIEFFPAEGDSIPMKEWRKATWETVAVADGHYCPALGLTKAYKGSWRG